MKTIRCAQCNRKLAEATFCSLSIKCPRCGAMNHLRVENPCQHAGERPCLGDHHGNQDAAGESPR